MIALLKESCETILLKAKDYKISIICDSINYLREA